MKISHLFFADDSLVFFKATVEEAMVVKNCLLEYERMSGQAVNFSKSCIIFSRNVGVQNGNAVAATFGMHRSDSSGKYLGLPLGIGRNKKEVFRYIETKLQQRFRGWNNKILSRAGKEVLLKSIARSFPTYTMSMYYLPITFCESLERLMNRFWWNAKGAGRKAKQGWRILSQPDSIVAKIFKTRYFPRSSFLEANIGANPSYCSRCQFRLSMRVNGVGVVICVAYFRLSKAIVYQWGTQIMLYPETVLHLMRDCPYTRDLWNDVPPIITSANSDSLEEWLAGWLGAKDTEVKHVFVARCWTVWKARNDFVWSHVPWSLEGVMAQVNNLLESWQTTNSSTTHVHVNGPTIVDNGVTPQALYFINVDATIFAERNEGGVAAVVHDRQGTFIAGRNKTVRCLQDPHLAEAMGIKEALSCAMECGWRNLVILSDCQLVCSSLRSSALYNSYVGCVLNDCFSLKRQFDYVSFRFIYRSANKIAHVLARDASSLSGPRSWFSDYPLCIQ
ncbi:PREDICTED: uncharacterized protein LOC109186207 [Ipomoea nil]|uniref:uncharacterized protein LOC109186207 n=1 Tax=Ipomoea nil TaxID=35883 RepID=UPI00090130AD|nr:PREDICTED: uncharacterized protein LOC109186207 [Ipomoea nil]